MEISHPLATLKNTASSPVAIQINTYIVDIPE
jgi:hypothetical protein